MPGEPPRIMVLARRGERESKMAAPCFSLCLPAEMQQKSCALFGYRKSCAAIAGGGGALQLPPDAGPVRHGALSGSLAHLDGERSLPPACRVAGAADRVGS